jgi:hypothetical protein
MVCCHFLSCPRIIFWLQICGRVGSNSRRRIPCDYSCGSGFFGWFPLQEFSGNFLIDLLLIFFLFSGSSLDGLFGSFWDKFS